MRFLYPQLLWLLTLLPILMIITGKKGPAPALLFSTTSVAKIISKPKKVTRYQLLTSLKLLGIACLIIALARPQLGNTTTEINASGIDIMLAVDVSGSMEAMDFRLQGKAVNRLDVVKKVVDSFIEERPNDRIGLIAFGGKPYLVSPLTLDHDWLRKRLGSLSIGMIEDGTAIGSAIGSSVNRLRDQRSKSKIVILLTDGINNSGKISPLIGAETAEALKIKVYTIGAGTRGEAPIPVVRFGRKHFVRAKVDIDEKTLQEVAEKTGAQYFRATDTESLEKIYAEINKMETTTRTIKKFENYRELFWLFLTMTFLFVLLSLFVNRYRLP